MYSTQQIYIQESSIYNGILKIGKYVVGLFVSFEKAVRACQIANQQPLDREAVWKIINED